MTQNSRAQMRAVYGMQGRSGVRSRRIRRARERRRLTALLLTAVIVIFLFKIILPDHPDMTLDVVAAEVPEGVRAWPKASDLAQEQNQTELNWVKENISMFDDVEEDRVIHNPGLTHFLYRYGNGNYESGAPVTIGTEELEYRIPLFLQWDARWGYDSYGETVIGLTGCGPACVAMVVAGLKCDPEVNPRVMAERATQGDYYVPDTGTKWSFIPDAVSAFGLDARQIGTTGEEVAQELDEGRVLVFNMGPGRFTTAGHFIVVYGQSKEALWINDPNSLENSNRRWSWEELSGEVRAAWSFGTAGQAR